MTIRRKVAAAGAILLCAGVVVVALRPTEARAAILLCAGCVVGALPPTGARGAIVKAAGAVQSVAAPPSVRSGAYVSSSKIRAFTENLTVTLPDALTVDAPVKAVSYNRRSQL